MEPATFAFSDISRISMKHELLLAKPCGEPTKDNFRCIYPIVIAFEQMYLRLQNYDPLSPMQGG